MKSCLESTSYTARTVRHKQGDPLYVILSCPGTIDTASPTASYMLVNTDVSWPLCRNMKSLIHKWTKTRKEKSKSSAGGSENGSRQSSSESHQYGHNKLGNSNSARADCPGMEAKDFGKVW